VLNGTVPVADDTRRRVLDAVKEMNYQPNSFARGLVTNRSGGIGVVVNEISSPYYSGLVGGIERVVEQVGAHLLVSSGHATKETELEALTFLRQRRSDAIIFQVDASSDEDILNWCRAAEVPMVVVGRFVPDLADACIYLDNERGGFLATDYLIQNGHEQIAFVTGLPTIKDSWERQHGYRRALEAAGLAYDERRVVEGNFVEEGGYRAVRRLLERGVPFSAVFLANDQMAAGAFQAFREAGLRIPEDVSVVGYDDVMFARYLYPALTTVRQPFHEMGQAAARVALSALGSAPLSDQKEVRRRFEPELIVRQSVKRL